jgi:hypothetical protein
VFLIISACSVGNGSSGNSNGTTASRSVPGVTIPATPNVTPIPVGTVPVTGTGSPQPAPGLPGVTPSSPGSIPAFTPTELDQFVLNNPIPGNMGGSNGNGNGTITQTEFLTGKQISDLLGGEPTEMPDDAPLAYVELSGDFTFPGVANNPNLHFKFAFEVFDAATGALIMEGGLDQPTTTQPTATPSQPTPTPQSTQPTATPAPVVQFNVTPLSGKQQCPKLVPFNLKLDNTGSTIAVGYSVSITDIAPNTAQYWATASPTSGTVGAGSSATVTVTPTEELCRASNLPQSGETFHVKVQMTSGGSSVFTVNYVIYPAPPIP